MRGDELRHPPLVAGCGLFARHGAVGLDAKAEAVYLVLFEFAEGGLRSIKGTRILPLVP